LSIEDNKSWILSVVGGDNLHVLPDHSLADVIRRIVGKKAVDDVVFQVGKEVVAPTVILSLDDVFDIDETWDAFSKDAVEGLFGRSENHMIKQRKDHVAVERAAGG
jgi:hypothetical protein